MNKSLLLNHITQYKNKIKSNKEQFDVDKEERKSRIEYYSSFTKDKILSMSFDDIYEYLTKLWAMLIWGNKEYIINKLIEDNGLVKIKSNLANLLYDKKPIEDRWDTFRKEIKGFGPAMISEILCHTFPDEFMIWNRKAKNAFLYLGIKDIPKYDYQLTGKRYKELSGVAKEILEVMKTEGIEDANLLAVDYFLWHELQADETDIIVPAVAIDEPEKLNETEKEFIHNDIRDKLAEIGRFLGFDTRTEQKVAEGSVVDAVWEMKVGNMGRILYVFEVQTKGSIDSLILNLLKAMNNPAVQGVVAVSDKKQLEKIRKHSGEVGSLDKKLKFWDYEEVNKIYNSLEFVNESINRLGLVPDSF